MFERASIRLPGLALAILSVLVIVSEFQRVLPRDWLWDFGSFVASGQAASEGLNPYGIYPLTFRVILPGFDAFNPNLNPPISALLFQPLGWADPHLMFRVWWGITMALHALTVFLILRNYSGAPRLIMALWAFALSGFWDTLLLGQIYLPLVLAGVSAWILLERGAEVWAGILRNYSGAPRLIMALWAFALSGFWDTLLLGQIYLPLVLAGVSAWILLERGAEVWAGILIGLVCAMKPNFAVWPALLLLSGTYRPALASIGCVAVVSAIPLAVFGPEIYRQWLELLAADQERAFFLTNVSLTGLAARAGLPALGMALSVLLLAASALWALRWRPAPLRASSVGLVVSLLASPIAWIHYTLFLIPVILRRWDLNGIRLVALLLIVPVPFIIAQFGRAPWTQFTIGSLYNWAMVLCLVVLAADELRLRRAETSAKSADPIGRSDEPGAIALSST